MSPLGEVTSSNRGSYIASLGPCGKSLDLYIEENGSSSTFPCACKVERIHSCFPCAKQECTKEGEWGRLTPSTDVGRAPKSPMPGDLATAAAAQNHPTIEARQPCIVLGTVAGPSRGYPGTLFAPWPHILYWVTVALYWVAISTG